MYKTVLFATDASAASDRALPEALHLLDAGGQLIVFHCDERFMAGRVGGMPVSADEPELVQKLRDQVQELKERGIDASLVVDVTTHSVPAEIAKAAEQHDADVIVCGTRGFGPVAGALAGSVAMRLPHVAPCPVVVISETAAARSVRVPA
jgi:nucleotide-binding universal stress UspA family protein